MFADFDLDYFGIASLRSISFDESGCCRAERLTSRMSARDSQLLLESVACHQLDSILIEGKRLTIPHRVSQAGLWEMWQRWGYECDESYATARGGAA